MNNEIKHKGLILDKVGNRIDVSVTIEGACSSCKVKHACAMAQGHEREISVQVYDPSHFAMGEEVEISITNGMGMKAVLLAYFVPFFILMFILVCLLSLGVGELLAGLSALSTVGVYYGVLFFFGRNIDREISFKIHKL